MGRFKYGEAGGFAIGNKGFIGKRVKSVAAPSQFTVVFLGTDSTGPSVNGPPQAYAGAASSQVANIPSNDQGGGLFTPDPFQIHGVDLSTFGQVSSGINDYFILILPQAGLPQNFFTKVSATLSNGHALNLTSASAQFNNPWDDTATTSGFTTWVWPTAEPQFINYSTPVTVT